MVARRFVCVALLGVLAGAASAQTPQPAIRLYVFDMGTLASANPRPLLDRGISTTDMCVTAYLIVHPNGTLIWDTGVIPDELVQPEGTTEGRATVRKTLRGQLAEIGYRPEDITYLAMSHSHYDHVANANEFAKSTWLVQKRERDIMFPDKPDKKNATTAARFSALRTAKTKLLYGDYDVFGDHSVIILSTPGHTPGHQSLFVRLARTGPVVLTGDLYHYPAERTIKGFNPYGGQVSEEEQHSRSQVEGALKHTGAQLWIGHDIVWFESAKKSPAFYE